MTKLFLIGLFSFLLVTPAVADNKSVALDRVAIVVNNNVITENQINKQVALMKQQFEQMHETIPSDKIIREQVTNHLIDIELQRDLAKTLQIQITDEQLNEAINNIAKKNGVGLAELRTKIEQEGLTYDNYRQEIRDQMTFAELQRRQLGGTLAVSDQEIQDYIAANPNIGKTNSSYHVEDWVVSLPESPTANQIDVAKLTAESFIAKLKQSANVEENPAFEHNDLGLRKLTELPEIFASPVQKMRVGEVIGPIRAGNGFHILKLVAVEGDGAKQTITETHVRHILIKTNALTNDAQAKERIYDIQRKITHGEDFAKVAALYSQDVTSAAKGGDIGWVTPETLDPGFATAMSQLKVGQISGPVKSQYGWHLIQVLGTKEVDNSKNYVRNQAKEMIFRRKVDEAVSNWLRQLRNQAYIRKPGEKV